MTQNPLWYKLIGNLLASEVLHLEAEKEEVKWEKEWEKVSKVTYCAADRSDWHSSGRGWLARCTAGRSACAATEGRHVGGTASPAGTVVLPGLPGQRDALIHVHQGNIVVVELRDVSVPESSGVVFRMHYHLFGKRHLWLWET